jgi:hypothetical protein
MANELTAGYGPLTHLFGTWKGDKGIDISPETDGDDINPYYEIMTFEKGGDTDNAETQTIAIARYHLSVRRKSNDSVFHDQVGYWLWDKANETIIHSLAIPRAVSLLAGGSFDSSKANDDEVTFEVEATDGGEWGIIQSPFMNKKAKTTSFKQTLRVSENKLWYTETMMIDIYGRQATHTDENTLEKVN